MTYRNMKQHCWVWYPSHTNFRAPASDHLAVSYSTIGALLEGPASLDSSLERPESGGPRGGRQMDVFSNLHGLRGELHQLREHCAVERQCRENQEPVPPTQVIKLTRAFAELFFRLTPLLERGVDHSSL